MKTQVIMTNQTDKEQGEPLRIYSFDSDAGNKPNPNPVDETVVSPVSKEEKQAALEMKKLKLLLGSTKKGCKTAFKAMKEKTKAAKSHKTKEEKINKEEKPEIKENKIVWSDDTMDEDYKTEPEEIESEDDTDVVNKLQASLVRLQKENQELKMQNKELENKTTNERVRELEAQVKKWQELYLEASEIGASNIGKFEKGIEAPPDEVESEETDRVKLLEAQLGETVSVLKTAQQKLMQRHEKEFRLQEKVDDLNEQLTIQKDAFARNKKILDSEREKNRSFQIELEHEKQRSDSYSKALAENQIDSKSLADSIADDLNPLSGLCCIGMSQ